MRINSKDDTLKRNYIQKYQFLISQYEQVKAKTHPVFKKAKDFYAHNGTCPQTFLKYYARYKMAGCDNIELFLPQKRGPRFRTRRAPEYLEKEVLRCRELGCNKYEICALIRKKFGENIISPSGIYNILKRHGKNKLTVPMKEEKRRIIKERAGELAHIDCHHLSKDMISSDPRKYYLVGVIDSCTRLAWVEVTKDIKALSVMFTTMHCFNELRSRYGIQFEEVLTDNGPEFGVKASTVKDEHPFERMLMEMDVKHRYIRPYRPQTNGKVERFWRTLNEDLIEGTYFESFEEFKQYLAEYNLYYNQERPHSALNGMTPLAFNNKLNENA
jgi:transposase InsO family protein